MIITEMIPISKQKIRITTDEQLAFVLYKGELSSYHLETGGELTDEIWQEIYQVLVKRAKLRAMHLLTKMDYTEAQLNQKLMQGGYTQEAVKCAVEYVKSFHYLDDERYVKKYMEQSSGSKSRRQKAFELEQKGISRELIRQWTEQADEETNDEVSLIQSLLEKRCKNPQSADEKEKMKHYGYLARKGFSRQDIVRVFEEYFSEID